MTVQYSTESMFAIVKAFQNMNSWMFYNNLKKKEKNITLKKKS